MNTYIRAVTSEVKILQTSLKYTPEEEFWKRNFLSFNYGGCLVSMLVFAGVPYKDGLPLYF